MSGLLRPRNLAIGAGVAGGLVLFAQSRTGQNFDPIRNPPNTLGVQNINARFSKAGGTEKGTPAVASTLGSADKEDTAHYHENNVASGKSSSRSDSKLSNKSEKKSGSLPGKPPGKGQEQKGAEDADANAADRKGQTGREGSHGNDCGTQADFHFHPQ
ncbi:hypothetical protein BDY17DRAFT_312443 [Neohortaea acidophila]|uniref:Uncharacterized protein n=1 Tax=Neohortaea acidophila TaxID=245834 RepID=A0A6A6PL85_9PEZI|nr:uncharacterized protein BDY17DRAFT_312443 [Neohortaea acidophila]KAF2480566.1 hypothetical protein BDY17DRAFT_312443 [Neohortaea acidophila]